MMGTQVYTGTLSQESIVTCLRIYMQLLVCACSSIHLMIYGFVSCKHGTVYKACTIGLEGISHSVPVWKFKPDLREALSESSRSVAIEIAHWLYHHECNGAFNLNGV